jgi:hypothetical protein
MQVPLTAWPEEDRNRWTAAFRAGDPFEECGPAAHLAERTRQDLHYHYGCFLGFLKAQYPERLALAAADRLDLDLITHYVPRVASPVAKGRSRLTFVSFVPRSSLSARRANGRGCCRSPSASRRKLRQNPNGIIL